MTRVSLALAALLFAAPTVVAHADVAGNWRVEFVVPKGEMAVTMTINQRDDTLTGQVVNEDGEFPLKGKVAGDEVTVTWTVPDSGQPLEITMEGTIAGEYINGVARLGSVGEGSLSARRVSRNQ
jgi:hypothetical protein